MPSIPTRDKTFWGVIAILLFPLMFVQAQASSGSLLGDGVDFYEYRLTGRSLDDIRNEAKQRAISTTVGSLYFENRFVVAPELLDVYLERRIDQFIAGIKAVNLQQGVGSITADIQVAVNRGRLERDLEEKRFFYEPKIRPFFHISLAETASGAPVASGPGRDQVANTLRELLARPTPFSISTPAPTLDVEANQELLFEAMVAARRQGIELILTGSVSAREERRERLYFQDYIFSEADIHLKLVRVQDGTVMREVRIAGRGSDPDPARSAENAIRRAAQDATHQILDGFFDEWRRISLDEGDYRILVREVNESELNSFLNRLRSMSEGVQADETGTDRVVNARVYLKSYVNNVAVINVFFKGDRAQLEQAIRESRYPQFIVQEFGERRIQLSRMLNSL